MKAAILTTGTELTRGELCDTNSQWLSDRLTEAGVNVVEHATVGDDLSRISAALLRLGGSVDLLIVTGGLGPTSDDRTSAAMAAALEVELVRDATSLAAIEARYTAAGRTMAESNRKQADFPRGAVPLANNVGTAPGFQVPLGRAIAFVTPGVPREMKHLYARHIAPWLAERVTRHTFQVHLRTFGLPESVLAERVADLDEGGAQADSRVSIGYRAGFPEVEVKVLARGRSLDEAKALAEDFAERARFRLAPFVFGGRDDTFPASVGRLLRDKGLRVATAESCTGGLIGKLLTDMPGSSQYFVGALVAYHNLAKTALLGVPQDLIEQHGAVSAEVVKAMAAGAKERTGADLTVAVSGIAGPGGGSSDKPVGTVWFGLAGPKIDPLAIHRRFPWERDRVRTYAAYFALMLLRDLACGDLDPSRMATGEPN